MMLRRLWLNVVLLVLVIGLAVVFYLEPGLKEPESLSLVPLTRDEIKQFSFTGPDGELRQLQREDEQWWLQQQQRVRASAFQVSRILDLVTAKSVQQYDAAGLDLAQYGLDRPGPRIEVMGHTLQFGSLNPVNYRRYVLVGETLHLIAGGDLSVMSADWFDLVDLSLLAKAVVISSLTVPGLGVLSRDDSGWQYQGDIEVKSADELVTLVDVWRYAQAIKIEPLMAVDADESVTLKVMGQSAPLVFSILSREKELILGREDLGLQYRFSESQTQRMLNL